MNDMRGISRLSLRRWFGGATGRRNTVALRQAAKNQADGHWTILDETQLWTPLEPQPCLAPWHRYHLNQWSTAVTPRPTPEQIADYWTIRRALPDDESHIERGTE